MLTKEQQYKNIDRFTEDVLNEVMSEGLAMGVPMEIQEMARLTVIAAGEATKSLVGKASPHMIGNVLILYGQAMLEAMPIEDQPEEGGRVVTQHINESISTKEGDEDDE